MVVGLVAIVVGVAVLAGSGPLARYLRERQGARGGAASSAWARGIVIACGLAFIAAGVVGVVSA